MREINNGYFGILSVISFLFALIIIQPDFSYATGSHNSEQGEKGEQGDRGPEGPQGPEGPAGPSAESESNNESSEEVGWPYDCFNTVKDPLTCFTDPVRTFEYAGEAPGKCRWYTYLAQKYLTKSDWYGKDQYYYWMHYKDRARGFARKAAHFCGRASTK